MSTGKLSSGKGNFDGTKAILGAEGDPCCCGGSASACCPHSEEVGPSGVKHMLCVVSDLQFCLRTNFCYDLSPYGGRSLFIESWDEDGTYCLSPTTQCAWYCSDTDPTKCTGFEQDGAIQNDDGTYRDCHPEDADGLGVLVGPLTGNIGIYATKDPATGLWTVQITASIPLEPMPELRIFQSDPTAWDCTGTKSFTNILPACAATPYDVVVDGNGIPQPTFYGSLASGGTVTLSMGGCP